MGQAESCARVTANTRIWIKSLLPSALCGDNLPIIGLQGERVVKILSDLAQAARQPFLDTDWSIIKDVTPNN